MLAVLRGEEVDRFPVWLKMTNPTWQNAQPEPYRSMDAVALLRAAGCDMILGCGLPLVAHRPHVVEQSHREGDVLTTVLETPDGILTKTDKVDPYTSSWHPQSCYAETLPNLAALRWYYTDTEYHVDPAQLAPHAERQRHIAEELDGVSSGGIGPSPLMRLLEHDCGPQALMYHLADAPALIDEIMALMHEDHLRQIKAAMPHYKADTYWLTENTSTTLISPSLFKRYCVPHLTAYGNAVLEYGCIPVHHMCGTLNLLLEMIDALPAMANEAYTTRPLGDVSLVEGRTRMPSKCLIGGTNATLWLSSPEVIVETVRQDLAACPDRRRIFLTSAGVLPAPVPFEKARIVVEGLKSL